MEAAIAGGVAAFPAFRRGRATVAKPCSRPFRAADRAQRRDRRDHHGESAKPLRFSEIEVDRAASTFALPPKRWDAPASVAARRQRRDVGYSAIVERRAIGLIGAIAPFNFPLNLVAHKLAPAFAVGNTVV